MQTIYLCHGGAVIQIDHPRSLDQLIKTLFPHAILSVGSVVDAQICVSEKVENRYVIYSNQQKVSEQLSANESILTLGNQAVELIAKCCKGVIALHAAAVVGTDKVIILPANTGCGKTSMAAWFVSQGYRYLTDELVLYDPIKKTFEAFYRPLNIKNSGLNAIRPIQQHLQTDKQIAASSVTLIPCIDGDNKARDQKHYYAAMFVFPNYMHESDMQIQPLSAAQTGLELMASNVNARNIDNHGFSEIAKLASRVPGFRLTYSDFSQLDNIIMPIIELILSSSIDMKILDALQKSGKHYNHLTKNQNRHCVQVPAVTPKSVHKKLCIGMATYDDYDGVYFTIQAIRLYHPEVLNDIEFLIIDNHPTGKCAQALKALDEKIDNLRYVPIVEKTGTAVRDSVFMQANSDFVLCIDCHVFIQPGAITQLLEYMKSNPDSEDLLQGPMYSDDLIQMYTHFEPIWQNGMYGVWAQDHRGLNLNAPEFEIPMQGLGLFACRKQSWPGLNNHFRGFGGEEGYLHEKIRRAGGRTLCLPFLRWTHRFERPMGVPYSVNWADRIRNYFIGFSELEMDTQPLINHFSEHVGQSITDNVLNSVKSELG